MNSLILGYLFKLLFSNTDLIIIGIVEEILFATNTIMCIFIVNLNGIGGQDFAKETEHTPKLNEDRLAEFSATIISDTELI